MDALPWWFGVLAAVVALVVVFVPKPIGLADNGDEARLPCHLGLAPTYAWGQTQYMNSVTFRWHHGAPPEGLNCGSRSSAIVPLRVAASISRALPGRPALDTRVLGVVYALGFGAAIALLVAGLPKRRRTRLLGGTLFVALATDVAFVTYFSSAYAEPTGYVAFLASVGLLMIGWRSEPPPGPAWLVAVTFAAATVAIAKPQFAVLALVFAAAIGLRRIGHRARWVARGAPIAAAALVLVVGVVSLRSNPPQFERINRYNAFFTELLGHSPDPAADLVAFGLPASWRRLAGTTSFERPKTMESKAFDRFYDRVTYPRLLAFYAAHPDRAARLAARGAKAGADPRVPYLGMLPYSASHPGLQRTCRWCPVSAFGRAVRPMAPVGAPVLWLGCVVVGAVDLRRSRHRSVPDGPAAQGVGVGIVVSAVSALLLFVGSVFGDGVEFTKHLYLADAAYLVMVVLAAVSLGDRFVSRSSSSATEPVGTAP